MATFKALNIEYDEVSDEEVDDTKEIQIEEALKLYQTALRYHAEGPPAFDQAATAYEELFASDIFKYPESQNELERIELLGSVDYDDWQLDVSDSAAVITSIDAGPSSLPQILHLSHKNYAQFKLEVLAHRLNTLQASLNLLLADASQALEHFVAALDKDDSDLDLWKNTARVGDVLDSKRITRFCLEAVLDGDEENLGSVLSLPGLDDGNATQQLATLINGINDYLSLFQPSLQHQHRKVLSRFLKQRLNTLDDLVDRVRAKRDGPVSNSITLQKHILARPQTWAEAGDILLKAREDEHIGSALREPLVVFDLPEDDADMQVVEHGIEATEIDTDDVFVEAPEHYQESPTAITADEKPVIIQDPASDRRQSIVSIAEPDGQAVALPSRKRSGDAAGLPDGADEGRVKSKRLRARDSLAEPEPKQALKEAYTQWELDQHLGEVSAADEWLYETTGPMLAKLGAPSFTGIKNVRLELQDSSLSRDKKHSIAQSHIWQFLNNYVDRTAQSLLAAASNLEVPIGVAKSNKDADRTRRQASQDRAELVDDGLATFLLSVNAEGATLDNAAANFLEMMTCPGIISGSLQAPYTSSTWGEQLKTIVVRSMVTFDEIIYDRATTALDSHRARMPDETLGDDDDKRQAFTRFRVHLQNLLELHLDVYCLIKRANSGVHAASIAEQGYRLERWFELTRESNYLWHHDPHYSKDRDMEARFLWATTFYLAALDDASQDQILSYMHDLRQRLEDDSVQIELGNNAVMPEISVAALDKEISKLTTREFFEKIGEMERSDPVSLIESIEPLLEALDDQQSRVNDAAVGNGTSELVSFLETKGFSEIFRLWNRLLEAYTQIGYKPMVVRTQLHMIRLVLRQLDNDKLEAAPEPERAAICLRALRLVSDLSAKLWDNVKMQADSLDCLDDQDIQQALEAIGQTLRLLQVFNLFEDPVRIGKNQAPTTATGATCLSFQPLLKHIHELQLRLWMTVYSIFKETLAQNPELSTTPLEDRFEFLRTLHRNLGFRGCCGGLKHVFLQLLVTEFFSMTHVDGYESEQAQVLYDVYGINCFVNPKNELIDHHISHTKTIDKTVAFQAVDLLLIQVKQLPMKELVKHSLKDAIDHVHGAIVRKRPTEAILRNREIIRAFLRSPIQPLDVFQSLKGDGNQVLIQHVPEADAPLAAKGWYFLMGHISLMKFRLMKRTGPTPTEDVDIAIAFFMQQLEYSTTHWETWFRLAQAYDTKIEESVVWSAEKLNNSADEVDMLQKAAVHCYVMAMALAHRSAGIAFETSEKMTEMYSEFALRLYSSSRTPFGMSPFALDGEKWFSRSTGMSKGKPFQPLEQYTVWKLAKALLRKAIAGNQKQWILHFTQAKCLWKMHKDGRSGSPSYEEVLAAIYRAIELVPGKKETRDTKREPILEPHYKLVSIVHKLVRRKTITLSQAEEALGHTHFVKLAEFPASEDGWIPFILGVLKNLRAADKAGWHHRMVAKTARILFEDLREPSERVRAEKVKHELTQQMFTKTMVLQVWRPEAERPGRHFVYTARYTRFFVRMLEILKSTTDIEMLARRVRRRPQDIWEHSAVWQDILTAWLRLLRERSMVPEGLETLTFSNIAHEDFVLRKQPLEQWMQKQDINAEDPTSGSDSIRALQVLREVQELKKINQNLMKAGAIDDLIGDCYAYLYAGMGMTLWKQERAQSEEAKANEPPQPIPEPSNPMRIMSLLSLDGAGGAPLKVESTPEPESAPAKRRLGINRREIRTAAEACYKMSLSGSSSRNSLSADRPRPSVPAPVDPAGEPSSAPGSVIDDADDESELSELEEAVDDDSIVDEIVVLPVVPRIAEMKGEEIEESDLDDTMVDASEQPAGENVGTP